LDLVNEPSLFVHDRPLLWLGTDVFLPQRARRLGKGAFDAQVFRQLVEAFEQRKIYNYHYWISSDHLTGWPELFAEFSYLYSLLDRYRYFGLLPHSPFIIPYASTPLYRLLTRSAEWKKQIVLKKKLEASLAALRLPLVCRVDTQWTHLNRLLSNGAMAAGRGFFDGVKEGDYLAAFQTFFSFLKQDRLLMESEGRTQEADQLKDLENKLGDLISRLLN
jgi:hypothetical protein